MGKNWTKTKLFFNLILLARNPYKAELALRLNPLLIELGCLKHSLEVVRLVEAKIQPEKYLLAKINLQELKSRPPGSLGRVYADHMLANNLDPEFFEKLKVTDEKTRFLLRARQIHDLYHILTGFSTSVEDELGLQGFLFAQIRYPMALLVIGAAILRLGFTNPPTAFVIFERVSLGWRIGLQARNLFALDWEANWSTPVEKLREDFKIQAVEPSHVDFRNPSQLVSKSIEISSAPSA